MITLRDFWKEADGVYNFINLNGEEVDDMNYPLDTPIKEIRHIEGEQYEVTLNVY